MAHHFPQDAVQGKKRAALLIGRKSGDQWDSFRRMFDDEAKRRIGQTFDLYPEILTMEDIEKRSEIIGEVAVLFGAWGFPVLDAGQVELFAKLEHVFYAAGSTKYFGAPFLERGIGIASSKKTNAEHVADYCFAQMLLAAKGYFHSLLAYRNAESYAQQKEEQGKVKGLARIEIGLIGCGEIARKLVKLLLARECHVRAHDPFVSDEEAKELGIEKASIEEIFEKCEIVSNHLPDLPELSKVIGYKQLVKLPENSVFINTGRGGQIDNEGLCSALKERPDLIALLDVTDPEPPLSDSPFFNYENIFLTPHIAGCLGEETKALVDEAIESSERWLLGLPLDNAEKLELYDRMA